MKENNHFFWIEAALNEAKANDDIPVAAIIVYNNKIIGKGVNQSANNPILHAEINAIIDAVDNHGWRPLRESVIYSTLEPCDMCKNAIRLSKIPEVVFSAYDIYTKNKFQTRFFGGFLEDCGATLLADFFNKLRGGRN